MQLVDKGEAKWRSVAAPQKPGFCVMANAENAALRTVPVRILRPLGRDAAEVNSRLWRVNSLFALSRGAPPGVDHALQKGRGKAYESVQKQRSSQGVLVFDFQPVIRNAADKTAAALAGPFVQGPPEGWFV